MYQRVAPGVETTGWYEESENQEAYSQEPDWPRHILDDDGYFRVMSST
jgi:hypothetical protein